MFSNNFRFVYHTLRFSYRTYVESEWCLKEFRDAHAHATGNGRKKFLVPVLCSDVSVRELGTDLKFYLENHTYIEYKNLVCNKFIFLPENFHRYTDFTLH